MRDTLTKAPSTGMEHHDSGTNIPRSPDALQAEEVSAPKNNYPITRRYSDIERSQPESEGGRFCSYVPEWQRLKLTERVSTAGSSGSTQRRTKILSSANCIAIFSGRRSAAKSGATLVDGADAGDNKGVREWTA